MYIQISNLMILYFADLRKLTAELHQHELLATLYMVFICNSFFIYASKDNSSLLDKKCFKNRFFFLIMAMYQSFAHIEYSKIYI